MPAVEKSDHASEGRKEDPGEIVDEGGEADLPFVDDDFGEGVANDNNQDREG